MKKLILVVSAIVLLSACGSAVKLDNVPVEDRSGVLATPVAADANKGGSSSAVGNGGVTPVNLTQANQDAAMQATTRTVYF
jgi:peptidoglycan-associated lipoprotein